MNQPLLNSIGVLVLGSALTFFATRYWTGKARRASDEERRSSEREAMKARVAELESQIKGVAVAVQPLSAAFQAMLVAKLTHFHTPVLDALLVKIDPPILTEEEKTQMFALLVERAEELNGSIDPYERAAADILPKVMFMVAADIEAEKTLLQTVSITKPDEPKSEA